MVSKNIFDPQVDGDSWRLTVDGLVERPLELSLADLQALPTTTDTNTLICISNRVGGQLISNATWSGAQLREVLERAGVQPAARFLKFTSADDYTESLPLDAALDENVRLVWLMNEEPLTRKHGYPLRAIIPGRYGMKNPKWITRITLQEEETRGYWVQRGWSLTAFIKTMSRIDVPGRGSHTVPGPSGVRGIAFAGDRGIDRLEVSLDDGETWHEARLERPISPFSWTRWQYDYQAETQGLHPAGPRHRRERRAADHGAHRHAAGRRQRLPSPHRAAAPRPLSRRAPAGWQERAWGGRLGVGRLPSLHVAGHHQQVALAPVAPNPRTPAAAPPARSRTRGRPPAPPPDHGPAARRAASSRAARRWRISPAPAAGPAPPAAPADSR